MKEYSRKRFDQQWVEKTKKINKEHVLRRGDVVMDYCGNKGVVVKLITGDSDSNHGFVYVWLSEIMDYGADNCEHYGWFKWQEQLRVLDVPDIDGTWIEDEK